jgi:hypothetical protein
MACACNDMGGRRCGWWARDSVEVTVCRVESGIFVTRSLVFLFLDRCRSQVFASHEHHTTDHIHRRRERQKPRRSRTANAETLREAHRHACTHRQSHIHTAPTYRQSIVECTLYAYIVCSRVTCSGKLQVACEASRPARNSSSRSRTISQGPPSPSRVLSLGCDNLQGTLMVSPLLMQLDELPLVGSAIDMR